MPKHIFRLVALIIGLVVAAVIGAPYLTVDSFYRFGHYRANAVPEIAAKVPVHQTAKYCKDCHTERHAVWSAGSHKSVNCEICHGAALDHPQKIGKLPIPKDTAKLCTLCHEKMTGRPATQPQIDVAAHSGGKQCITCHNPHSPKIAVSDVKVTGNAAAGKKLAGDCATCRGADGNSPNDTWPTLAGQNAAYLARILGAYKSGGQKDAMMTPMAQDLSDADIQNLAVYFASVSCKGMPPTKPIGNVAAGKTLAENCAACHGATGAGANPAWPKLAAQKSGYLINALKAFRAGLRKDPMMSGAAKSLSDANIADVSAFFAAQSCQSTK